jgi:hypothetical protein
MKVCLHSVLISKKTFQSDKKSVDGVRFEVSTAVTMMIVIFWEMIIISVDGVLEKELFGCLKTQLNSRMHSVGIKVFFFFSILRQAVCLRKWFITAP